jgi:type IV pilus assembly protein PilM
MSEQKKPEDNIVKKVFDRPGARVDRISPLFTHFKKVPKTKVKKPVKVSAPKSGAKRLSAAIDFGSSRIKLLQIAQGKSGEFEVALMDEELLSPDPNSAQILKSKQALEKILSRNPISPQVIVGLPAKETQTFNFTFPAMSEEELREAVKWKIKQIRPFDLGEDMVKYAILRWDTAPSIPVQGRQQKVTVVCVSNDNLSQKTTLLNEAGLKPLSIHASALTLIRTKYLGNVSKTADEVVLWLDLGAEESVFIVEKGGVVYFLRNLSVTGQQLTRQVSQACRVDEKNAEELKIRHGLNYWTPQLQNNAVSEEDRKNPSVPVCLALISILENLVTDIEHSFKFFSYQVTQSQISKFDRVILTGGAANLKKIENFLSDRLAVPVEKLNPFSSIRMQEALKNQRTNPLEDGLKFASALGLALVQRPDSSKLFNFIGVEKKRSGPNPILQKLSQPKFITAFAVGVCLILIAPQMATVTFYKKEADSVTRRVKTSREELKQRQSNQLDFAEQERVLLEKKAALDERIALFAQSRRDDPHGFSGLLVKLATLVPEEVWVTKLAYSEKKLVLVGSTFKNEYVMNFLENLKKPEEFSDVVFNYTKRTATSSIFSFEVMMNVK